MMIMRILQCTVSRKFEKFLILKIAKFSDIFISIGYNTKDVGLAKNYRPNFLDHLKSKDIKLNLELNKLLKQNKAQMPYENIQQSTKGANFNLRTNPTEAAKQNVLAEKFLPFDHLHQNFTHVINLSKKNFFHFKMNEKKNSLQKVLIT